MRRRNVRDRSRGPDQSRTRCRTRRRARARKAYLDAPEGTPTPALRERSAAPSGLRPSSFVMGNTPVEVQFTSAGRAAPESMEWSDHGGTVGLIRGDERRLTAVSVGDAVVELPLDPPQRFAPVSGQVELGRGQGKLPFDRWMQTNQRRAVFRPSCSRAILLVRVPVCRRHWYSEVRIC
jgi:hypothetical protein